jgi:YidC/Oxa1 family membrane protein insertase
MRSSLNPEGFKPISTDAIFYSSFTEPNAEIFEEIKIYTGPKSLESLEAHTPSLGKAIDFGWFSPICIPMLWTMRSFFSLIPNWGLAIILLTLLVKLITLPLNLKQYKSMAAMKKIQPEVAALKEKFKDDASQLQQATMGLYRQHGVNPLSGCLPMLVMMPIYFALYRTIFSAVELYQAPFFGWLSDLSQPDPYFITPILLGGLMLVQARFQPNTGMDETQRKMMTFFMPIMFGGMMLFLPSGLVLYILVNTVLGIAQQNWSKKQVEAAA